MASKTQTTGTISTGTVQIAYKLDRSARRKRTISFFLESQSSLRILAPLKTSLQTINSILQQRLPWILRKKQELESIQPLSKQRYLHGNTLLYLGHYYHLNVIFDKDTPQGCALSPRRLTVNLHNTGLCPRDLEAETRLEILLWLKKRARAKFERRLTLWADILGVSYKKIILSNAGRRWGSCNYQNIIRLNWRLIMAPLALIDYVVVHELCHIPHKNHSRHFWKLVAKTMPDYLERENILKTSGSRFMM